METHDSLDLLSMTDRVLVTLYITPVIYIYLDVLQEKMSKRFSTFRSKEKLVRQEIE